MKTQANRKHIEFITGVKGANDNFSAVAALKPEPEGVDPDKPDRDQYG